MASKRCGCASDNCACVVTGGVGVQVSGAGTKTNPYILDADIPITPLDVQENNVTIRAGTSQIDFRGAGVDVAAGDAGEAVVTIPGTQQASGYPVTKIVGHWLPTWDPGSLAATNVVNNRKSWLPLDLSEPLRFDRWGVYQTTLGVAGTQTLGIALYVADPVTGLPSGSDILGIPAAAPPVNLTTNLSGTAAGWVNPSNVFATPITIPPGRYWLSTYVQASGQTTIAALSYVNKWDARVAVAAAASANPTMVTTSYQYCSGLVDTAATQIGGAVPANFFSQASWAWAVLLRLAA